MNPDSSSSSLSDRPSNELPIGVFDSGVGGLTVLRALQTVLPGERFIYLGDTARLPYGSKGEDTVRRYAVQAAKVLAARGIKLLVIACNTASAVALEAVQGALPDIPVVGVIEAGVEAACVATPEGHGVLVTATRGTIRGGAYQRLIKEKKPNVSVLGVPCPLFVALAEEGWGDGEIARAVAKRYLGAYLGPGAAVEVSTIVLGCTHFPMLASSILAVARELTGRELSLVDSAQTTAQQVLGVLQSQGLATPATTATTATTATPGTEEALDADSPPAPGRAGPRFLATDSIESFAAAGAAFLGYPIDTHAVEWVDL